ncbi:hypothetical protein ABW20_dc0103326 [Dactylellina cionopaga]|nr:hypothetical protein ABW20_dc0103326 [Dactylellina cionopaga]
MKLRSNKETSPESQTPVTGESTVVSISNTLKDTTITSLPNELLIETFTRESLTNADLANIKRVCKFFNVVAPTPSQSYKFSVDALTNPTWKLIRALLENPKIGLQFTDITLDWERRDVNDGPEKWAPVWDWTPEEVVKIKEVCKKWEIEPRAILGGVNSEALLPLLLCFTPNLESLDLGNIELECIVDCMERWGADSDKVRRAYWILSGHDADEEPNRDWDPNSIHLPDAQYSTWFFESAKSELLSPGLANLRHFAHNISSTYVSDYTAGLSGSCLRPIFFLPKLESIKSFGCGTWNGSGFDDMGFRREDFGKSRVKRLTLCDSILAQKNLVSIAKITGALEYVKLSQNYSDYDFLYEEELSWKKIAKSFLECNLDALTISNLYYETYQSYEEDSDEDED